MPTQTKIRTIRNGCSKRFNVLERCRPESASSEAEPRWAAGPGNAKRTAVAVGGLAAALLLGAYDFPGTGTGGGSGTDGLSEAEKTRIAEEWRDCLAKGGLKGEINDDGGTIDIAGGDHTDEQMREIEAGCQSILDGYEGATDPELSPEEQAQLADGMVKVERCLTEQGYVVNVSPDGGIDMTSEDVQPEDFDEAVYNEAEEACMKAAMPELFEKYGEN